MTSILSFLCVYCITNDKMTTYNIIGDIHGRTNWKELVDKTYINIFVGDFFDPYTWIPYADLRRNFLEIIAFKHKFPDNVILLYGNHDYEYLPGIFEESNRYDALNARKITKLLTDNASSFYGVAYAIGERYLVTHAGLTRPWVMKYIPEAVDFLPSKMEEAVNTLWLNDKLAFGFSGNGDFGDYNGESIGHSPLWVRPTSFGKANVYSQTDVIQVVGHTKVKTITETDNAIFVDCLGVSTESKKISLD